MASQNLRTVVTAVLIALTTAQDQPLLSTIAKVADLSKFSSVILSSGGSRPNPAFEERFNSALDGRNYTAFAPTNKAFEKIPPALVEALTAAPAYPILESIVRTHVAEGRFASADVVRASPIVAIEGFRITAAPSGANASIIVNDQAQVVAVDTPASNGVVHQIDQVLNPYTGYFGISNATAAPKTSKKDGTIADILLHDDRLTTIRDILQALNPDLIGNRLALSEAGGSPQIFAVPSNDAFAGLPGNTKESATAPFNQALSLQLFSFGLLDSNAQKISDIDFSRGPVKITNVFTRINVTATQVAGGATLLNNAAIQEQACGSNGCLWIVDRVLDPLYLAFGPLDRGKPGQ